MTTSLAPPRLSLSIRYRTSSAPSRARLAVRFGGEPRLVETVTLAEESGVLSRTIDLPGAKLWSPEAPNLNTCQIQLGNDDLCLRVGLRRLETRGRQLLLNDEPLSLRGVNRHQSHPELGHSVCDAVELGDLQLVRELGANFVRSSHYPMNSTFLDLCDEAGILVWNEAIGWQHGVEQLTEPAFLDAQLAHLEEMVAMSRNHPSVIIWGVLNESASHEERAHDAYARLLGRLRELDPSRPVTYASNHPEDDRCFDLCDIISVNCYPGWYHGTLPEISQWLDNLLAGLERKQPDKPLLIAEIRRSRALRLARLAPRTLERGLPGRAPGAFALASFRGRARGRGGHLAVL